MAKKRSSLAVAVLLPLLSLAGCATPGKPDCPRWTYENQDRWASLCPAYRECAGTTQSPRPLSPNRPAPLPLVDARYAKSSFSVKNDKDQYRISAKALSTENRLVIGNDSYRLEEIHFHNPGEHTLPGSAGSFPVEIHLVHYNPEKKESAVVAVFMVEKEGAPNNPAFEQILENVAKEDIQIDPAVLLPLRQPRLDYRYLGSKTAPPCDPGIRWHILAEPIVIPPIQIAALKKFYAKTARHPQRNSEPVFEVRPAGPAG